MSAVEQRWVTPDLRGKVAVVTGASRGLGRGIAVVLGECGATVHVTGRSARGGPMTMSRSRQGVEAPNVGTIDETAELVTARGSARGGRGIAVQVDHTVDEQVEALFDRIDREHGRLDVLVNNVWGGYQNSEGYSRPFWEQPIWRWDVMFDTGVRAHFVASRAAARLVLARGSGVIVTTGYPEQHQPGHLVEIAKQAANGLTNMMAQQFRGHGVAALTVAPTGWVWDWETLQLARRRLQAGQEVGPDLEKGESPEYAGRAVALLAADANVLEKSGRVWGVNELARIYDFTDIDGRQPGTRPR